MSVRLITSAPSSDAAYRADLIGQFVAAADWTAELHLLAEAADYDRANPDAPSLTDELVGSRLPAAA
jgi:hypothetical protein